MTGIESNEQRELLNLPYFFTLERYDQRRALESLIFASEDPLTTRVIHRILVLEDPTQEVPGQQPLPLDSSAPQQSEKSTTFDVPKGYFDELVDEINDELEMGDRPFRIVRIAGGFQFATTPQHGQLVQRLLKARNKRRLTQAALETLAIVAYRQPLTKAEVDAIRGVNTGEVMNSLVEKELVAMVGRSEAVGKPILYGTTDEFLRVFGLNSLYDLPKLREIDDLLKTAASIVESDDTITLTPDHRILRRQLSELLERPSEIASVATDESNQSEDQFTGALDSYDQTDTPADSHSANEDMDGINEDATEPSE